MTAPPPVFSDLLANLADANPDIRRSAIRQLPFWYRARARRPLQGALQDRSAAVRLETVGALRQLQDPRVIPALLPLLADRSSRMRRAVVAPVLVLISTLTAYHLDLFFSIIELAVLGVATFLYSEITQDGELVWLEGALLLLIYAMMGSTVFLFGA